MNSEELLAPIQHLLPKKDDDLVPVFSIGDTIIPSRTSRPPETAVTDREANQDSKTPLEAITEVHDNITDQNKTDAATDESTEKTQTEKDSKDEEAPEKNCTEKDLENREESGSAVEEAASQPESTAPTLGEESSPSISNIPLETQSTIPLQSKDIPVDEKEAEKYKFY